MLTLLGLKVTLRKKNHLLTEQRLGNLTLLSSINTRSCHLTCYTSPHSLQWMLLLRSLSWSPRTPGTLGVQNKNSYLTRLWIVSTIEGFLNTSVVKIQNGLPEQNFFQYRKSLIFLSPPKYGKCQLPPLEIRSKGLSSTNFGISTTRPNNVIDTTLNIPSVLSPSTWIL